METGLCNAANTFKSLYLQRALVQWRRKEGVVILAEVVDTNEPVIEDGFSAVVSLLGFGWRRKLHHGPFQVTLIPNLEKNCQ